VLPWRRTALDALTHPGKSAARVPQSLMANVTDTVSPAQNQGEGAWAPTPAHGRERTAIRNVTLLLVLRGLIVAGGVATAALIPRTMGPATYGRYDLVTMLTFWFSMLGALGIGQIVNRQTPVLEHEGATGKLRVLFGNLLALRIVSSATVAILYFLIMRLWLRDLDWPILLVLSVVVLARGPASLCYSLFLGQGRIGRWAVPEVVRQWGSVAFALPCFLAAGLLGAVCGYLISEAVIVAIGFAGARRTIAGPAVRLDLRAVAPFLRVGLGFYAGDLLLSAIDRSGAVLVRTVTGDYAQVGLFGVSYQIFIAAVLSTNQISASFVPLITVLRTRQEHAELRLWVERLIKWLVIAATFGFLGSLFLGKDVVPLVLGRAYASVYRNVIALSAALLLLPLTNVCAVLALTHDRPSILFKSALLRLLCFWGLGLPLASRWGSLGACVSVFLATAVQALYYVWKNWEVVGSAFARWSVAVGAGLVFTPLVLLRASVAMNLALYLVAAGGYLVTLRMLGLISTRELRAVYEALGNAKVERRKTVEVGS
jgi:O-antigen/teichoic acid export membrane protein